MSSLTNDLSVARVVATESEAELVCSLLRSADIRCATRLTNHGAGASEGMPQGGPHEILVLTEDLPAARDLLGSESTSLPASAERGS